MLYRQSVRAVSATHEYIVSYFSQYSVIVGGFAKAVLGKEGGGLRVPRTYRISMFNFRCLTPCSAPGMKSDTMLSIFFSRKPGGSFFKIETGHIVESCLELPIVWIPIIDFFEIQNM